MCQGTLGTTRTPLLSFLALAEWHICQSVISSKLLGDTALRSGKPEDTTNSRLEALALDLDYFYHTGNRRDLQVVGVATHHQQTRRVTVNTPGCSARSTAPSARSRRRSTEGVCGSIVS